VHGRRAADDFEKASLFAKYETLRQREGKIGSGLGVRL
jgi:hypothetical protein